MNLIRASIDRPIAVVAVVLMVVMFGVVALTRIPIQLTPDVRQPTISIRTIWPGAAPAEIEREVVNRQEDVLKGIEGLREIVSRSEDGRGQITLEFSVGTNMDKSLLLVANRLDRVEGYPEEADEPTISTSGSEDNPIAWFVVTRSEGDERPMHTFGDFVTDTLKERLERVPGVSNSNVYGGSEREMRITVEPELMAHYRLTVTDVLQALRNANAFVSAGDVEEGKRRYVVRTEGELNSPEAVRAVVLRSVEDPATGRSARVTMGDIAEVDFAYKDPTARIRYLGQAAIALNAQRETGANVIETMDGIRDAVAELNEYALPSQGLTMTQVYDETVYINSAIDLVRQNIWVGGTLAAMILLLFLRSGRATLVVSLAIPVSVVGSFVAMAALGRSLNVISLAGFAFAVGMVVDAAIVVLESIYRMREKGKPAPVAAYEGTQQVWGAVLVSALTTVMVFIPVLVMDLEVGQLFRDIGVAISVSVLLSLLVSTTVIPALAKTLLGGRHRTGFEDGAIKRRKLPLIDDIAAWFVATVLAFTRSVSHSRALAGGVVAAMIGIALIAAWVLLPKLEYLPEGNRNLVFGIILPPPGYNLETTTGIAESIEAQVRPLWPESTKGSPEVDGVPTMQRFFFVATRSSTFLGAAANDPARVAELIPVLERPVYREPGTFGIITQYPIFGRGIGGGRSISLDVSGPDLEQVVGVAQKAAFLVSQAMPREQGNQLRPQPGLELGAPEVRVLPDRVRLADTGVTARQLADTIDAFNDGLRVDEITVDNREIDLMLQGPEQNIVATQGIENLPVVTSSGHILPASALAQVILTAGPTEIRHLERERTITLEIRPRPDLALEAALDTLRADVIEPLQAAGLPPGLKIGLSGTADKLTETWNHMVLDLLLALIIVYLVMAILFESFVYPLIILLSVPLAAAGGVAGLALLNVAVFNPLDMLTLLGFVILIGIVVNNAILLVHQTLLHIRQDGMAAAEAILEATRNRIRPIFMSTLTSVFGMLPLVVFPGAGSELYRGLGSVVIGGLALSAVLTLLVVPPMLSLTVGLLERGRPGEPREAPGDSKPAPAE